MTRIDRNPALASLRFIIITVTGVSFVFAGLASALFDSPFRYVFGYLLTYAVFLALIFGIVALLYRGLSWDADAQTARFGRHDVPLESITEAWRKMSAGGGSAAYLTYRFTSTTGHSVRVLIAGSPLRGLTEDGITELERFIAAIPIDSVPLGDGQLTQEQRVLIDSMTPDGGTSRVGGALLLHELRELRGAEPSGSANTDQHSEARSASESVSALRVHAAQDADDENALRYLVDHRPRGARRARRVLFWLIVIVIAVACVAIVIAVVLETTGGSLLDSDTNDVIASIVAVSMLSGVLLYVGWCIAADNDVRGLRSTAKAWLNARGASQRERGLAPPLFAGWNEPAPGTRLRNVLSFASGMIGMTGVIAGPVLLSENYALLTSAIVFVVGLVFLALTIIGFRKSRREGRASARELILLAGPRLLPPGAEQS